MDVDSTLQRRISVAAAARFLGCSMRHVRDLIKSGDLDAIDVRSKGKGRATWGIAVAELRAFIAERERASKNDIGVDGMTTRDGFQAPSNRAKVGT